MGVLIEQLQNSLPVGMYIPEPFFLLYDWIERNGLYKDINGYRYGFLYPESEILSNTNPNEQVGGTSIEFVSGGHNKGEILAWFGKNNSEAITDRLCLFAQAGAEGSMAGFWLDDNNEIKIVVMGSGSGSIAMCILAENAVDFMRLLAIGYSEVCWLEDFPFPPNHNKDYIVKPNEPFQQWVINTFNVSIPKTGVEIVKHPAEMMDNNMEDKFHQWWQKHFQE